MIVGKRGIGGFLEGWVVEEIKPLMVLDGDERPNGVC